MRTLLLLLAVAPVAGATDPASLAWMSGCWAFERDGKRYEEVWLPPAADGAIGMARTTKAGRTVDSEFTRLAVVDGRLSYVALPAGQAQAVFPVVKLEGTAVAFENPQHDFPTRVLYRYTAPDRLDARIEGRIDGKDKAVDYPFRRAPCPGQ